MLIDNDKFNISEDKLNINLLFYFYLKHLTKLNLTKVQAEKLYVSLIHSPEKLKALDEYREVIKRSAAKLSEYDNILTNIADNSVELFIFALQLYMIKDHLMNSAHLRYCAKQNELSKYDLLSLKYDRESLMVPYTKRVNGALLSSLFFNKLESNEMNFIVDPIHDYLQGLSDTAKKLKLDGVESNQIFMLPFSESLNQSIISDSGSNYEERIYNTLVKIGIPPNSISKEHDVDDKSTEYDFKFEIDGKSFGIGAKKTLRERYKQYIKTALSSKIDVDIQITIGLDLNEEKARTIRQHGIFIFVADEIYSQRVFMQEMEGVYPASSLTLDTLKLIANLV